jgi:hypothetical protein
MAERRLVREPGNGPDPHPRPRPGGSTLVSAPQLAFQFRPCGGMLDQLFVGQVRTAIEQVRQQLDNSYQIDIGEPEILTLCVDGRERLGVWLPGLLPIGDDSARLRSALARPGSIRWTSKPRRASSRATHRQPVVASIATAASFPCHSIAQSPSCPRDGSKRLCPQLARLRIEHHRPEHTLVNIDPCVQHPVGPPFVIEVRPRR